MSEHPIEPVQVHVVTDSTRARKGATRGAYGTFLLTAALNAEQVLPPVAHERDAIVMGVDTAIVLADTLNAAVGGYGTYIPAGVAWVVKDQGAVFAGAVLAGASTCRVSVSAYMEQP